ncbi:RND efflux transporter [Arcobacter nitrofigilis DSM 7299]|uniref:RND efflux transporter n=1 Tax=Arcobacter nitrofigilis (strain ATCC 33309 / DSM 7299 / CCUG 15893 / LMG 7604 / NCTC 12251 / CI) TaxID=572480 RepID=D5V0R0_ARCNC|nr:MMPL family transporter [Arcobacter nitrofigilis]ADG93872.1 RND efflux transporter [Arcobacter nitrofigilis DSM 7299]
MNKKEKLAHNIIKYRWSIAILIPILIIIIFALNIHKAGVETDWKIWFDKDSKVMKNFTHFKETFGSDDRIMIVLSDKNSIFKKDILKNIKTITESLWQTKLIARVDSITNYQYSHVSKEDEDEIIVEDFIDNIDSLTKKDLEEKKEIAISDPQTKNLLISADGKSAIIIARIVYKENIKANDYITLYNASKKLIEENKIKGVEYHIVGVPAFTDAFINAIKSNFIMFMPLLFICIVVLLALIFRNIWAVVLPLTIVILTILFIAGFSFGLGYKLNTLTSMFPIFVIAIGIADSIHIFWVWIHKRKEGLNNEESIVFSINKNFTPALITSLTTFVGFLSLGVSKIIPLQAFGIVVASGAIIAFILSILFLPAMLSILNPKIKEQKQKVYKTHERIKSYTNFVVKNDKAIIISCLIVISICFIGLKDTTIDTDFLKQFSKTTDIRKSTDFVEKNIGGTISMEIIIDSKKASGINKPDFMKDVEKFKIEFKNHFSKVRHINSITDVVKKYNQLMNGNKKEFYKIPDSKELISQYLLLYSLSLPQGMGINDMMDTKNRYLRLTSMNNLASEQEKLKMYRWTEDWWKQNSKYSATLEGLTLVTAHMKIELTNTMIKSVLLALLFVTLIFWFTFKSKFYMLISAVPNIAPLLIAMGITGWIGINMDLGMAIVFVIIIGIAIDDTVHFLSKYKDAISKGYTTRDAIEKALLLSGSAIVITTVILVTALGIFLLSDFTIYSNFGFVSSIALFCAMILDLLLLPASLSYMSKIK